MSPTDVPADPTAPTGPIDGRPLLTVRGLRKSFGDNRVLESIDLEVHAGQVLALIGASGSGKTTVLRCLNGLEVADGGTIELDGAAADGSGLRVDFATPPTRSSLSALRDRSGMVFQHYNLFPHMTVLHNVIEGPVVVQRRPREDAIAEARALLDRVGLGDKADSYPFELSGGQQQRVGIVRALALRPQLLLFDEPTSALDPELVGEVLTMIRGLKADGMTMVLATHAMGFARQVADRVVFLDGGRVLEAGPPEQAPGDPVEPRTPQLLARIIEAGRL